MLWKLQGLVLNVKQIKNGYYRLNIFWDINGNQKKILASNSGVLSCQCTCIEVKVTILHFEPTFADQKGVVGSRKENF